MWFKKILIILIALIGLVLALTPVTSGTNAYFAGEDFFIGNVDQVEEGYPAFLTELVALDQKELGFKDKQNYRSNIQPLVDSLEKEIIEAREKRDTSREFKFMKEKKQLIKQIQTTEFSIMDKYSVDLIPKEKLQKQIDKKRDSISMQKYIVISANEIGNPNDNSTIKSFVKNDINTKKISSQDSGPYIISGILLILIAGFIFVYDNGFIQLHKTSVKYIIGVSFLILTVFMAVKVYSSVSNLIEFQDKLAFRKSVVINKLENIRTLQLTYFEEKGSYADDWKKLTNFAKNDSAAFVKYLVNKDDTAAVNNALRTNSPLEETIYVPVLKKCFPHKNIEVDSLPMIPFSNKTFEIDAGKIERNGRPVHLFEVKTTYFNFIENLKKLVPENFDKKKEMKLGSMSEATTEGNW